MAIDNIPGPRVFRQRDVRETPSGTISIANQLAPIGSITAWLKSFANVPALPAGWVECDGAVINDADSVFNGQNTPDLNGGIFLEGQATSGATGGSATMAHTHTATTGNNSSAVTPQSGSGDVAAASPHTHSLTTSAASNDENRPPFYTVVWIMRIK